MRENFLVFGEPEILEEDIAEVVDSLRKCWIGTGPKVSRFVADFASYKGVDRAVALGSCTAGLHLGLLALDIGPGDEVITTPLTFCATINAIIHAGAMPVLVDVDPLTHNIDATRLEAAVTERTKAVIIVHFAGRACDIEAILGVTRKHGLKLIEDCAHALETKYQGRQAGTFGDIGAFSFYATKNLTTGEGGMIIGKDDAVLSRVSSLSLHGLSADAWKRFSDEGYKHYLVIEAGFKYNMMDIQAALGIHQLARIESNWTKREAIWNRYLEAFAGLPLELPAPVPDGDRHAYHLFTPLLRPGATLDQYEFLEALKKRNIGAGVHYLSMVEHPYYSERFGWRAEDWPVAMDIGRRTFSLPLSPKLCAQDVDDVIEAVTDILE